MFRCSVIIYVFFLFQGWIDEIKEEKVGDTSKKPKNFAEIPVRGTGVITKNDKVIIPGKVKPPNPNRIKSWEYDKWEKFDVDTELTKLDISHMQREEEERIEKLRLEEMSKPKAKSTKPAAPQQPQGQMIKPKTQTKPKLPEPRPCCSKTLIKEELQESWFENSTQSRQNENKLYPSFIEEVPAEPIAEKKPKRRVKIVIDDVHLG